LLRQKKVIKEKATPTIRLFPAVLTTRGTRTNRPMARKSARSGLMVRVYNRALLRSSGRIHGDPVEQIFDRFAMRITSTRMRASGLRWLLRVSDRANVRAMNADVIALDMVRDWRFETEKRLRHATRFLSDQHEFDGAPMDSPRGAEQRAVVDPHHEPTGCASAQLSGDLCGSRALRAPQETGESLGSPSFGYFSWRSKKSDWPRAATERAGGTRYLCSERNHPPLPLPRGDKPYAGFDTLRLSSQCRTRMLASGFPQTPSRSDPASVRPGPHGFAPRSGAFRGRRCVVGTHSA